jgi:hypothetical protein
MRGPRGRIPTADEMPVASYHQLTVDAAIVGTLVGAFGLLVTAHVALCAALLWRQPRWRALAALCLPPLAPYWGYKEGWRAGSLVWVAAFCAYAVARMAAAI